MDEHNNNKKSKIKRTKQQPEKHFPCETFIEIILWYFFVVVVCQRIH